MKTGPLVSCLLATADRPHFVPQAIRYFLRQDYPDRELIVVDDGAASIANLLPEDSRIDYIRRQDPLTIGAKHNLACEVARGEVIIN